MNDIEKLWIPKLIFKNNKEKHDTTNDISRTKLFISNEGNVIWSSSETLEDLARFKGTENPIVMEHLAELKFECDFNFILFPFDTQVNFHIYEYI